jgi:hypothetical protein
MTTRTFTLSTAEADRRPHRPGDAGSSPRMGMLNVTQHWFDHDMDQWGKTLGHEVQDQGNRLSRLLGPDGAPLVYPKARIGFDLTPRARR